MDKVRCLVTFIQILGAVVIVSGQSTTNNACSDQDDHVVNDISELKSELKRALSEIGKLRTTVTRLEADIENLKANQTTMRTTERNYDVETPFAASYTRWGRKTCENNSTLVYQGYAAGSHYTHSGSGSNYLCLPETPQWGNYIDGDRRWSGYIAGANYEVHSANSDFSNANNNGQSLLDKPAPCAVCYTAGRSTVLMIPAMTQCPAGWSQEYSGYLVSNYRGYQKTSYVCLDEAPEVATGGTHINQALFYPVEVFCGNLPCSVYISGRELACVVCSK